MKVSEPRPSGDGSEPALLRVAEGEIEPSRQVSASTLATTGGNATESAQGHDLRSRPSSAG